MIFPKTIVVNFTKLKIFILLFAFLQLISFSFSTTTLANDGEGEEIKDITPPTIIALDEEIYLQRALPTPEDLVLEGVDDIAIAGFVFSLIGPGVDFQEIEVKATDLSEKTYQWKLAEVFYQITGLTDLSTVEYGDYLVDYSVIDTAGNRSETLKSKFLLRPTMPNIDPVSSPTKVKTQLITGQKDLGTAIFLNGKKIIPEDDNLFWQLEVELIEGANQFRFESYQDGFYSQPVNTEIVLKTTTPNPVRDVTISLNSQIQVVLNWVNPDEADYSGIKIIRFENGIPKLLGVYPKTTTNYLDQQVIVGRTYSYDILVFDLVGNETGIVPVEITVQKLIEKKSTTTSSPSPKLIASASISDSDIEEPTAEEPSEEDVLGEEETDEVTLTDTAGTELPYWGLILLLLLASVAIYLFIVQWPFTKTNKPKLMSDKLPVEKKATGKKAVKQPKKPPKK